ncbi:intraflagellar transport protein 46 homolog [Argonauta hians]
MALPPTHEASTVSKAQLHLNQPYDESLEIPDADDVPSSFTPTPRSYNPVGRLSNPSIDQSASPHLLTTSNETAKKLLSKSLGQGCNISDDDDDDEDVSDDDEEEDVHVEGAYDPADYDSLQVNSDIKDLFEFISRYSYQVIELEHKLKPFIPDFIPSVGDTDAFIKIPRPDSKADMVGLTVLDEPCASQSDPTVLDLQLRNISKQSTAKQMVVKSLDQAENDPKQIDNWIQNIDKLHRSKPPPNVHYTKNIPPIDNLMQEWPPQFEALLKQVSLPSANMDISLADYIRTICCILDIPVYQTSHSNDMIQSLHVLFTLYNEFQNSQHFQALAQENKAKKEDQLLLEPDNDTSIGS